MLCIIVRISDHRLFVHTVHLLCALARGRLNIDLIPSGPHLRRHGLSQLQVYERRKRISKYSRNSISSHRARYVM